MKIAIIGAGQVGTTLGRGFAAKGHEIIYGSRSAGSEPPHAGARVASIRDAVVASEVAVLTTPWQGAMDAVRAAGDFGGRPLLDVTNPIGPGFALAVGHTTSGAEELQKVATNARVVKAFNVTGLENMAEPRFGERRAFMPVAGDDAGAREIAARLATDLGFDAVALKSLARAREIEPLAMVWIKLALQLGQGRGFAFGLAKRSEGAARPAIARNTAPTTITVVGTGNIGGALASAWLAAGHRVHLGVRDASQDEVQALVRAGATAGPIDGAANASEVVVLAVPASAATELAPKLGDLAGKIVVDVTNAIGPGFTLKLGHTTSSSEALQRTLPSARVVRAFHQQGAETLRNPSFGGQRAASFVAADDDGARAKVIALSNDVGLDTIATGPLANARILDPITILWVSMSQVLGTRDFALTILRR